MRSMDPTQQLWKGNAPSVLSLVVVWRSLLNTAKVSIALTVVTSVSYIFLQDHRCEEHEVSSMGASVEVGDQGDQVPEPQQPEDCGTAKPVEPTSGE